MDRLLQFPTANYYAALNEPCNATYLTVEYHKDNGQTCLLSTIHNSEFRQASKQRKLLLPEVYAVCVVRL